MIHHDEHDIIGTRVRRAPESLGPLFDAPRTVEDAEAEIRHDFLEPEEQDANDPSSIAAPLTESEREVVREGIKALVAPRLIRRAEHLVNAARPGITADDVHEIVADAGLSAALGGQQRAWSWVGPWLEELARAGQLVALEQGGGPAYRRSTRAGSHGNLGRIYLHPRDLRAQRVA